MPLLIKFLVISQAVESVEMHMMDVWGYSLQVRERWLPLGFGCLSKGILRRLIENATQTRPRGCACTGAAGARGCLCCFLTPEKLLYAKEKVDLGFMG